MEPDGRTASRLTKDFDIAPTNSAAPTCSKGLHRCLFCGKPGCVSLNAVGLRLAISDLFFGKNAAKEPLAKSCDGFRDTWNFDDVNSRADNHGSTLARRLDQPVSAVDQLSMNELGPLHDGVGPRRLGIINVQHLMSVRNQPVRNQHAVAAKVHPLSTHVGDG